MELPQTQSLKRVIKLPLLIFYGIGTILGAGIYILVGKVAGYAGLYTPVSFLLAAVLAGFTAFSYAELSVRFPSSAGEAVYIQEGLRYQPLSIFIGLLIVVVGVTSAATLVTGLTGYVQVLVSVPNNLIVVVTILILAAVVAWGIGESLLIASLMTVVEIFGLLMILWVARAGFSELPSRIDELVPDLDGMVWGGIMLGCLVAFYAFIGFEDIVNVAEEVVQPERNLPRAILWALGVTTLFYILVSVASILVVKPAELAGSDAPLAYVYQRMGGSDSGLIAIISIVSVLNGALIQIVMASRILYGMSRRQWLPARLGYVHPRFQTPVNATLVVMLFILALAVLLPLLSLAKLTSLITLTIFSLINLSLFVLKLRGQSSPGFSVPVWVPLLGFVLTGGFLLSLGSTLLRV